MIRPSRLAAVLGTLGVAAALVVVASTGSAATAPGTVSFDPTSGAATDNVVLTTAAGCPQSATHLWVRVTGGDAGTPSSQVTGGVIVPVSLVSAYNSTPSGGLIVPLTMSFHDFAQQEGFTPIKGTYTLTVTCRTQADPASLLDYAGGLVFTPGAGAFDGTYVLEPYATTTTLDVTPTAPVVQGTSVTLTATVAPAAAGTVQFKDGATNVGGAVTVAAGTAQYVTTGLAAGTRSLTAVFTPTNPAAYSGSTSAPVSYQITMLPPAFLPTVWPAPRVGIASSCIVSASSATTLAYSWLKDGVVIGGATARTYTIPEAAYHHQIACRATASNADNAPLVGTSPGASAGVGPALRPTQKPYLSGTVKVGYRVYCKPGAWTPAATSYSYRWQLNGVYISSTATSIVIPSTWHGKYVNCVVTAKRAAWTNGVAASNKIKVP